MDESIFSRIAITTSAQEAWSTLKTEYQGSVRVIGVKLQFLRRDFESASMKNNETVQEYLAKIYSIVSQMRTYGDAIADKTVVGMILKSLTTKFDHVVAAIEESKDLTSYSVDELMGSLQTHEVRINRNTAKEEDQAFQVQGEQTRFLYNIGRGRGNSKEEVVVEQVQSSEHIATCLDTSLMNVGAKINKHTTWKRVEDYLFMTHVSPQLAFKKYLVY